MKRLFLNDEKAFTLIELIIVIAIISIVISFAIIEYLNYQNKAKISSYAEPLARLCMMDISAWCVENPGLRPRAVSLGNCSITTINTAGGTVTLILGTIPNCQADGQPGDAEVSATLSGIVNYTAKCNYSSQSIKCTIEG